LTMKIKTLFAISALYLIFFLVVTWVSGHLYYLGDASLFFSWWTDAPGYKLIADYYTSLGNSERPSDYLLALRPFMFPLYLGLYHLIGIAGVQVLQMIMNAASLWLVFESTKSLSNRTWIAGVSTTLLALTPSFTFVAFHALTESLSIFLVCMFIALIVDRYKNSRQTSLFLATFVVSILLCIRPVILPFWTVFVAYYVICWLRERRRSVWQPIMSITPIFCQLILSFAMTGSPTLSSSGVVNISTWYFPLVFTKNEYGKLMSRKSKEAEEGRRQHPELKDKIMYLWKNYRTAIKTYVYLLVVDNLTAKSIFVQHAGQTEDGRKIVLVDLMKWSIFLNRLFACVHAIMLALMIWLIASWRRVYREKAMLVCYLFAVSLILPTGFASPWQGDRYILLAEPLWLVAYGTLVSLFIDRWSSRLITSPKCIHPSA